MVFGYKFRLLAGISPLIRKQIERYDIRVIIKKILDRWRNSGLSFIVKKKTTTQKVITALKKAKKNPIWKNVIELSDEGLVSSDIIGNPYSAIIDLPFTNVIDGDMIKVLAWYDNEWGYSSRLAEMAIEAGRK